MAWQQLPGNAIDVGVGWDGSAWIVGPNAVAGGFEILRWTGDGWQSIPGGAARIAVSPEGTPWIVNPAGNIFRRDGDVWTALPGSARDIGVGANGAAWVVGSNAVAGGFGIFQWTGNDWRSVPGGAERIAVSADGTPWVVDSGGGISRREGDHWVALPGAATDIGVGNGANLMACVVGTNLAGFGGNETYLWSGGTWVPMLGSGVAIAVSPEGDVWVVNNETRIFESPASFAFEAKNWAENILVRPRRILRPVSLEGIIQIVGDAHANDRRVRAAGSLWSYSDVATTSDVIIDTSGLSGVLGYHTKGTTWSPPSGAPPSPVLLNALDPKIASSDRRFVHVLGGTTLRDFFLALDSPTDDGRSRWAVPTMGGSAGQSLAGLISTSSHGGDFDRAPIVEMVCAIDLVAPDGTRHWFERSAAAIVMAAPGAVATPLAITAPDALARVFATEAVPPTLHYDDQEFFSALVSMGCFGVIHAFIVEVVEQFGISQRVGVSSWQKVRASLKDHSLFESLPPWATIDSVKAHPPEGNPKPLGLEILLNPYRLSDDYVNDPSPDRECIVVSRASSATVIDAPQPGVSCIVDFVDMLLLGGVINDFKNGNAIHARVPVAEVMATARKEVAGYPVGWSVAAGSKEGGKLPAMSVEFAIPEKRCYEFVDELLAAFDATIAANIDAKLAGFFSLRFTKPSSAHLALQNFGPDVAAVDGALVCHIELSPLQHIFGIDLIHPGPVREFDDRDYFGRKNLNEMEGTGELHARTFEEIAARSGVHLHWGQMSLTGNHNPGIYPAADVARWKILRDKLTANGTIRTFDNDFTVRYRIAALATSSHVLCGSALPGSPTNSPVNAAPTRSYPPTAFINSEGRVEVLVINADGNVCWCCQEVDNGEFAGWAFVQQPDVGDETILPFNFVGRVAIGFNRGDSHPEAFVLDANSGRIHHAWRAAVSDHQWTEWSGFDGEHAFVSSPDVAMGAADNLAMIARRDDDRILFRDQRTDFGVVGWNGWSLLPELPPGRTFVGDPCLARNANGALEVFTRDQDGAVWHSTQSGPSSSEWRPWTPLGVVRVSGDLTVHSHDTLGGRLAVYGLWDDRLAQIIQIVVGDWAGSHWEIIGNELLQGRPSALVSPTMPPSSGAATRLVVASMTMAGDGIVVVEPFLEPPRVTKLDCSPITATSAPSLVANQNGTLMVFTKTQTDVVQFRAQDDLGAWPPRAVRVGDLDSVSVPVA